MRQGCPSSPLLYILQAEQFAWAIRKNENIIGIPLPYTDPVTGKLLNSDQTSIICWWYPVFLIVPRNQF